MAALEGMVKGLTASPGGIHCIVPACIWILSEAVVQRQISKHLIPKNVVRNIKFLVS